MYQSLLLQRGLSVNGNSSRCTPALRLHSVKNHARLTLLQGWGCFDHRYSF
jgi:hypothetical protein